MKYIDHIKQKHILLAVITTTAPIFWVGQIKGWQIFLLYPLSIASGYLLLSNIIEKLATGNIRYRFYAGPESMSLEESRKRPFGDWTSVFIPLLMFLLFFIAALSYVEW
jgi:hypothetical protein